MGLRADCVSYIGHPLLIRTANGWGWSRHVGGKSVPVVDVRELCDSISVVPDSFFRYQCPVRGFVGHVVSQHHPFSGLTALAFTMNGGDDYDFTYNVCLPWRLFFGNGRPSFPVDSFPTLAGADIYHGYGTVAENEHFIEMMRQNLRKRDPFNGLGESPV